MQNQYDVVMIGSGQAAKPLTVALAQAGRRVALVEREHVGGTCINEGCTPSKTMIASARVAYLARRAADYGVQHGPVTVDMAQVRQRKRAIVESFRSSGERQIEQAGVSLLRGEASFAGPKTLVLQMNDGSSQQISAETIVINVGARPAPTGVPGSEHVPTLNSTTVMELDVVPEQLLVLGGGYIGVEFGQAFRRFGSQVTIVQRGAQLLAREDDDIAEALAAVLRDDGIEILTDTAAVAVRQHNGQIELSVRTPDGERTLRGSHLLVATGRTPNSDSLNLAAAGIVADDKGFIQVNERLETNVPGVYAVGDVTGGPAFTHVSYDDFRILQTNLLHGGHASTAGRVIPYTVFTDPQLGRVGMSEREARASGRNIRVASMPMSWVARALEMDESRGLMKAVVDADNQHILGYACLGIEGGELATMVQMAMLGKLPASTLRDAIFSHPTLGEALNTLFGMVSE
ncbi:MAG: mercuric reductase [Chloroflexaceae bacterium]|jgi:pyruvate/2-oxoglutarate dehydrogenase complex dihydrolipoamide dehydrogenase (E3) component|nr:mercuric reductase [Chloroflexaceae bacterium]